MSAHNIPFLIYKKKKIILHYPKSTAMGFFLRLKNVFETAVVNEPSEFEPLKFYCNSTKNISKDFNVFTQRKK